MNQTITMDSRRDDKYLEERHGNYRVKLYDRKAKKLVSVGTFRSVEEAQYRRQIARYGHHWNGMPRNAPGKYFGFVYEMVHKETGQRYIGSKQFFRWNGPSGGYKMTDPSSPEWDPALWEPHDWPEYTSSSKDVSAMAHGKPWDFEYDVIHLAKSKLDLHLLEIKEQVDRNVLTEVDEDGNYVYMNQQILGVEYRPVVPIGKLRAARDADELKIRDYYLRPAQCNTCGEVIPYGQTQCPRQPLFGNGSCRG